MGFPQSAWTHPLQYLTARSVTKVSNIKSLVYKAVTAFENGKWQQEILSYPVLQRVYLRLKLELRPHLAQYLQSKRGRHRRLMVRARVSNLPVLDSVKRRQERPPLPFASRTPCPVCDANTPEGVEHFLLECGAWRTQRRDMWADLTDTAKIDPRVAGVISQALASDNRSVLLRVVLQGNCVDDMPDGYNTPMRDCSNESTQAASTARKVVAQRAGLFPSLIERARRDLQYKRDRARDTAACTTAPTAGLTDGA